LLDEPTSGLDTKSEAVVIDALRHVAKNRTVVMVSHRLKLAAIADRVVVLDGGEITEQGEPRVLLTAGRAFAGMWAEQTLPNLTTKSRGAVLGKSDIVVPLDLAR
jgi:ABC-type multidrug transport system fused ATPase/permease subunit